MSGETLSDALHVGLRREGVAGRDEIEVGQILRLRPLAF
jgi:hypothetical protein